MEGGLGLWSLYLGRGRKFKFSLGYVWLSQEHINRLKTTNVEQLLIFCCVKKWLSSLALPAVLD